MKNGDQALHHRRLIPWTISITLAGFVLGGGIAAAATMTGSTSNTTATGATSSQTDLSTLLSASNTPKATAPGTRLGRLRRAGGIYGTITYRGKDGTDHTVAFERGTITTVGSTSVVVRAPDGTTMTWQLTSATVVRQHRAKVTTATLRDGERVFIGGPVTTGAKDARLIVIRAATGATS